MVYRRCVLHGGWANAQLVIPSSVLVLRLIDRTYRTNIDYHYKAIPIMVRINRQKTRKATRKVRMLPSGRRDIVHNPERMPLSGNCFGYPERLVTKLRYSAMEGLLMTSTSGSVAKYFFSTNSIFDPDRTGTGHQPLYRDSYAAVYDHYAVLKSEIVVRYINTSASYFNCGLVIEDDNAGSSVIDTISEQNMSTTNFMTPLTGSRSELTLRKRWNAENKLNIDPYTSELYKTDFVSNPQEEQFFTLWCNDAGGGTNSLLFHAEIVYTVLFTELQTPTQS